MADVNTYTEAPVYSCTHAVAPTQAHLTRTTCFARRVRSRSDNVSGVFGEHRPPSPAGRLDSTRERKATEGVNLFCGDHRARRGPLQRGWGCHGTRERGDHDETHGPIGESTRKGMAR